MTLLGLGLDLVEVEPFARQLAVVGTSFAEQTFTPGELARAASTEQPGSTGFARHLAARFAAKEAFVKAWSMARAGLPPAMKEVAWQDLEVVLDDWGRPSLRLAGRTSVRVAETLGRVSIAVSLTHEDSVAAAVVVINAVRSDDAPAGATGADELSSAAVDRGAPR